MGCPSGDGFLGVLFPIFYLVVASLGLILMLISVSFVFSFLFSIFFRGGPLWGWIFEFSFLFSIRLGPP